MKTNFKEYKGRIASICLAGAAAAILTAAPFMPSFAADTDAQAGATTKQTQQTAQQGRHRMPPHPRFNPDQRINQYVSDGTITQDQADKLKKALKEEHEKQQKEHETFMKNLPKKTGISEDTLKKIMPQRPQPRRAPHDGQMMPPPQDEQK